MKKQLITIGLAAGLTAGAGAAMILGQAGLAGAAAPASIAAGGDHGPRHDRVAEVLATLVESGTITQAQADAVLAALDAAKPVAPGAARLDAAATAVGLTTDELKAALDGGSTIADVAASKGVATQTVVDAIVAGVKADLDAKVAAGTITQEQADRRLTAATAGATRFVEGAGPSHDRSGERPGGRRGPGHRPAPRGERGELPAVPATASPAEAGS